MLSDDDALRMRITEQGLNTVIARGEHAGQSTAFLLTGSKEGRSILAADESN